MLKLSRLSVPSRENDVIPASSVTSTRLWSPTAAMPRGHFKPLAKVRTSHGALVHPTGIACTLKLLLSVMSTWSPTHVTAAAKPDSCCSPLPGPDPPSTSEQLAVQSSPSEQLVHLKTPLAPARPPKTMKSEWWHQARPPKSKDPWSPGPRARSTSTSGVMGQELSWHQGSICTTYLVFNAIRRLLFHGSRPPYDASPFAITTGLLHPSLEPHPSRRTKSPAGKPVKKMAPWSEPGTSTPIAECQVARSTNNFMRAAATTHGSTEPVFLTRPKIVFTQAERQSSLEPPPKRIQLVDTILEKHSKSWKPTIIIA